MLKGIITVLVSCFMMSWGLPLGASSSGADSNPLHRLQERAASSEISFSYTYSASSGKVSMSGRGEVLLHGDAYRLEVDGLEVYCDGKDRWTLDKKAREAVVEPVAPGDADLSANPALLLSRAADFFTLADTARCTVDGEQLLRMDLSPVDCPQFRAVSIYIASDGSDTVKKVSVTSADGTVTDFILLDYRYSPAVDDLSRFRADVSALDASWVITDLR